MNSISFLFPVFFLFPLLGFSESLKPAEDRRKVEFFEKLYGSKIKGVKPIDEYQDPDTFYSEIAKQVGIPEIVYEAVEKKFGWKNDEENFLALKYIKLSKEHHPDLLISKGVPIEVINESKNKMRAINAAWDQVQKLKNN